MVSAKDDCMTEQPAAAEVVADSVEMIENDIEAAQKMFQLGKKNLFLNKYDESVNNIGEACKIYSNKYGEFGEQCAEIYFFYGKSLLELARIETTVLGNALTGVPEENEIEAGLEKIDDSLYGNPDDVSAEEKKEISEQVIDALCNTEEQAKEEVTGESIETKLVDGEVKPVEAEVTPVEAEVKSVEVEVKPVETEVKSVEGEVKVEDKDVTGKEEEGEEEEEGDEEGEEEEEESDEQIKDEAEAEEISNLQQAWEMFEMAKLTYTKNFENDQVFKKKRIAECLLKLGEISVEQENFPQAVLDIGEAIKIQEEIATESRDERMLAESFYELGLALQFNNQFTEANEAFQKSINIIQFRIEKLKSKLELITGTDSDSELERNTMKEEITEMETVLPEMKIKLEEVNDQGQQSINLIKEAKECFLNVASTVATSVEGTTLNGDVKDITNLLKSKRKMSSSNLNEIENDVKKTKISNENESPADSNIETVTTTTTTTNVADSTMTKIETSSVEMTTDTAVATA